MLLLCVSPGLAQSISRDRDRCLIVAAPVANAPSMTTAGAAATSTMPSWGSIVTDLPGDARHVPSKANALWLAGGGALALGLHNEDANLTRRAVGSAGLDATLEAGAFLGGGVIQVGGALSTFAIGKVSGRPAVASVGSDLWRNGTAARESGVCHTHCQWSRFIRPMSSEDTCPVPLRSVANFWRRGDVP